MTLLLLHPFAVFPRAVFVETLDRVFENVCELDLIFHSDKVAGIHVLIEPIRPINECGFPFKQVHHVLDEIVMGGMVLETNIQSILMSVSEMNKLEQASVKMTIDGEKRKQLIKPS